MIQEANRQKLIAYKILTILLAHKTNIRHTSVMLLLLLLYYYYRLKWVILIDDIDTTQIYVLS